jgi:hypothetical protein
MRYEFVTTCVSSTERAIRAMSDEAREITYLTAARRLGAPLLAETFPDYAWGPGRKDELRLRDDTIAARFYRSRYRGRPCIDVQHSGIDHIFCPVRGEG